LPDSQDGIDETLETAAGYLKRCTQPSDRLLVAENLPEVYYFARRRFAAGQMVFFGGFYTTDAQQREAIDRWSLQAVPLVLTQSGERFATEFASDYPMLTAYLRSRYHNAGQLTIERGAVVDVWVDRDRTFVRDQASGLPCEPARN
jgi:hypothetical protein